METCRICLNKERSFHIPSPLLTCLSLNSGYTQECAEDLDGDELLAPCKCKGTMRLVHRSCLEEWRRTSFPGGNTFYRCDMCRAHYKFHSKSWQRIVTTKLAVSVYSGVLCAMLMLGAVFCAYRCREAVEDLVNPHYVVQQNEQSVLGQKNRYAFNILDTLFSAIEGATNKICDYVLTRSFNLSNKALVEHMYMEYRGDIAAGLSSLALFELLIVDGSTGLSLNLMFSLWRIIYYKFRVDYYFSTIIVSIGLLYLFRDLNKIISIVMARLLVLKVANYHEKEN